MCKQGSIFLKQKFICFIQNNVSRNLIKNIEPYYHKLHAVMYLPTSPTYIFDQAHCVQIILKIVQLILKFYSLLMCTPARDIVYSYTLLVCMVLTVMKYGYKIRIINNTGTPGKLHSIEIRLLIYITTNSLQKICEYRYCPAHTKWNDRPKDQETRNRTVVSPFCNINHHIFSLDVMTALCNIKNYFCRVMFLIVSL